MAPAARVEVAPLGIVLGEPSAPKPRERGTLALGFLGTIAPHKGLGLLLDALEQLERPASLVVAGPSSDHRYLRSLQRRALDARLDIEWRGAYEHTALADVLADVDVVIAPSQVPEVFPLATREALAHGIPVVAASQPGLADVVVDGVNGLLFAPGDADELAACIERIGASPGLLGTLRAGANSTASLSRAEHVHQLRSLYAEVVSGPRTSEDARIVLDQLHDEALRAGFASRNRLRRRSTGAR
jgi:glycosyltransferase involved in cell wall biosynthesis